MGVWERSPSGVAVALAKTDLVASFRAGRVFASCRLLDRVNDDSFDHAGDELYDGWYVELARGAGTRSEPSPPRRRTSD